MAWTTSDERQRQCCLDNGTSKASGPMKEVTVIAPKIAAVERREACVPVLTARGTSKGAKD